MPRCNIRGPHFKFKEYAMKKTALFASLLLSAGFVAPAMADTTFPKTSAGFEKCLKAALKAKPGQVVKVELKNERGEGYNYEFDIETADGKAWDKDSWKRPVKAAAAAAKLPDTTKAYNLRHSVITDLIGAGLDVLTVARLSGTSVAMIERHYGHLLADHAAPAHRRDVRRRIYR